MPKNAEGCCPPGRQSSGIRTGRATPGLVDSIRVEVYGSMQPLKQLASIGTPDPQQIVIRPYDAGTIKEIEKAIVAGDLGLNPQNDGRIIRLNVLALSTEVRKKRSLASRSSRRIARFHGTSVETQTNLRTPKKKPRKSVKMIVTK